MKKLLFYPVLNKSLLFKMGYNFDEEFYFEFYNDNQEINMDIKIEDKNSTTVIMDDINKRWYVDKHNLIVNRKIKFNPKVLFGESGIVSSDATIGIALKSTSNKSSNRDIKEIKRFNVNDELINIDTSYNFEKNRINDDVHYSIILFLADVGEQDNKNESHLINVPGTILGNLSEIRMIFKGSKSSFNTVTVSDKDLPLWFLRSDFIPENNVYDSIELVINESHKDYGLLDPNDNKYNLEFIREISINIVTMIISRGYQMIEEIQNTTYDQGTIGYLVQKYIELYEIHNDDIMEIHKNVCEGIRK